MDSSERLIMDEGKKKYLFTWIATCMATLMLAAVLNFVVDPYILFDAPRITGLNERKPIVVTQERMMKPYDVMRFRPNTLIIGTSRTDMGLDALHPAWPSNMRPVYNLAMAGGIPYVSYRHLQHVLSYQKVKLVVMGLEAEWFIQFGEADAPRLKEPTAADPAEYEFRLATTSDGFPTNKRHRQYWSDISRVFSLYALRDSAETVLSNLSSTSADIANGGVIKVEGGIRSVTGRGAFLLFTISDLGSVRQVHGTSGAAILHRVSVLRLRSLLELCRKNSIQVILFMSPAHADTLEIYDKAGLWPMLEDWKREIVALVAQYSDASVSLWDFNDYDRFSTESVALNKHALKAYWDPYHYKRVVGDAIVARIFGGDDAQFGVLLTPENLESHLVDVRVRQKLYRQHARIDAERIDHLYKVVSQSIPEE
jgi:hypothetical protein